MGRPPVLFCPYPVGSNNSGQAAASPAHRVFPAHRVIDNVRDVSYYKL